MPVDLRALYDRWLLELWNGDLAVAADVVAEDFVGSWPGEPAKVRGRDALVAVVRQGRDAIADLRFEIEVGPVVDGDLVAARWVGRSGGAVVITGHDLLRAERGRFAEYWVMSAMAPG